MQYLVAFLEIEKAFWHRVFFVKRFMILFMFGVPPLSILQLSNYGYAFGGLMWWLCVSFVVLLFYIFLPMILYLLDPKVFFPEER